MLLMLVASSAARAAPTYLFDGSYINGCSLSDKVYTCPNIGTLPPDGIILIASGYTLNVQSDITFQYNQGLTMSGTARLTSTGNLNIADLPPSNLNISGGSLSAGGTFKAGNQVQTIKANITAATMVLGSGSPLEITGTVTATGTVQIAYSTTINGALSGSTITTDASVKIRGNVTATTRFTLQSGGTVTGSVTAPEVLLLAAGSTVTGNVIASTSLIMGSGAKVNGDVDTGYLRLEASGTIIRGNAAVTSALLQSQTSVQKIITCKNGTVTGKCDCVDNQSGYPINSADGPTCESGKPAAGALRHFLITHDGSAGTCTTERVTVTACANAACSAPHYGGGASATLQPGGAAISTGTSGTTTADVSSIATGIIKLSLANTSTSVQCYNSVTKTSSCDMNFTGDVNFEINVPHHKAGNPVTASIQALKANATATACIPGFNNEKKNVEYSCNYVLPNTGAGQMSLDSTSAVQNDAKSFVCNTTTTTTRETSFDGAGVGKLTLVYPDAGKVVLNAKLDKIMGKEEFVVAPDHFDFEPPASLRAGADFDLKVYARNLAGETTPNFHKSGLSTGATTTKISRDCTGGNLTGALTESMVEYDKGVAIATMSFNEAGYLDLKASLDNFLGAGLATVNSSGDLATDQCEARIGPFVPWTFQVELFDAVRKAANFYYAGEPIGVRITALNKQGQPTTNYPKGYGAGQIIKFTALQEPGTPLADTLGTLIGTYAANGFSSGFAPAAGSTPPAPAYAFKSVTQAPMQIRLRADNSETKSELLITSATATVGTNLPETEQARPWIRTGRLRLGNRFGRTGTSQIEMPLTVDYWSGKSWVVNDQDSFTVIPASAFAQTTSTGSTAPPITQKVDIKKGAGVLPLTSSQPGWIDVAINLGLSGLDTSCLATKAQSTAAKLPWLRSPVACPTQPAKLTPDPSARATFGIFPVENRRIIHMREVFN